MKSRLLIAASLIATLGAGVELGRYYGAAKPEMAQPAASVAAPAKQQRKILYYRNPMGLPDTSPTPKIDAMGMDYVPVYEGEEEPGSAEQVKLGVEKVQKLGVRTEAAALREFSRTLRVVGKVQADERKTYTIAPRFEGWIAKLYVNATGQAVSRGQPLLDVYSPDLISAQREYAIAASGLEAMREAEPQAQRGVRQLADAGLARLRNWEIDDEQLRQLNSSGEARQTLTFRSPVAGFVMEKKAVQGMRFMPGEALYQVADLATVWVIADVFEQDLSLVRLGQHAKVRIDAYPDKTFDAKVSYVYPALNAATRTVPVRLELANPNGLLKPDMYASVELAADRNGKVLSIPLSSVIHSGIRQVVLVEVADGRYEPREVRLGAQGDDYDEVLEGVGEGEKVVVAANFLIDAESNLKAALAGFGHAHGGSAQGGSAQGKPAAATEHAGHEQSATEQPKPAIVGHQAKGTLNAVNADGSVNISHEAIKSLGWDAMTMDYPLANPALVQGIKPGSAITFEFVERKPDEWVITRMQAEPPKTHERH